MDVLARLGRPTRDGNWFSRAIATNPLEVTMKRLALTLILLSLTTLFLGACHTVAGVGKDVQSAGDAIEGASGKD